MKMVVQLLGACRTTKQAGVELKGGPTTGSSERSAARPAAEPERLGGCLKGELAGTLMFSTGR